MKEININELYETMLKQGKKQEFKELIEKYHNYEYQAKYIEYFGEIKENKIILSNIFDFEDETYKLVKVMDVKKDITVRETFELYFLETLQDLIYSNIPVKYALFNPSFKRDYFEIAVEKQ